MTKKKRYTVANTGGEWVVWKQKPELRWVAKCPNKQTAYQLARVLNAANV